MLFNKPGAATEQTEPICHPPHPFLYFTVDVPFRLRAIVYNNDSSNNNVDNNVNNDNNNDNDI